MTTIDEIKARCAAATAGPWKFSDTIACAKVWKNTIGRIAFVTASEAMIDQLDMDEHQSISLANAEFIAAARTDIPLLVKALELACEYMASSDVEYYGSKPAESWLELAAKELANV